MQVPISQLTGAVILNPVPRSNVVGASEEVSFDAQSHSPNAPNGPTNGATTTAEPLPNSEKLQLKSGKVALPELPPPPPPPPPLPPTRRHCQKQYYFGGGEGEMQRGRGFSNTVHIIRRRTSCRFNYSAERTSSLKRCVLPASGRLKFHVTFYKETFALQSTITLPVVLTRVSDIIECFFVKFFRIPAIRNGGAKWNVIIAREEQEEAKDRGRRGDPNYERDGCCRHEEEL